MPKRRKGRPQPMPLLGPEAFGDDPLGRATGSAAFGDGDPAVPLRGALLFGNDPEGNPTGSDAFGGPSAKLPLRGALLFGNDPEGNPTGSEAFGNPNAKLPLRGALLFGNDPQGNPTGSDAFGNPDAQVQYRGAMAVGAPQGFVDKLYKDDIGYDFGGVLLVADEGTLAGIRRDGRDHLRQRIIRILERRLAMDVNKLRHGLGENAIKWGRLRRDPELDRPLAEALRNHYRRAPGEVLGIGHVRDLLEETERMHTFALRGEWDVRPIRLTVLWGDEEVGFAESTVHKQHSYFVFKDPEGTILAYVDALVPHRGNQEARVRAANGAAVGCFALQRPEAGSEAEPEGDPKRRMRGMVYDAAGHERFSLEEERVSPRHFRAKLSDAASGDDVGCIEDRLRRGKIETTIELDIDMPCVMAWGLAAIMADLARLRRAGWPDAPAVEELEVESVAAALGPRRSRTSPADDAASGPDIAEDALDDQPVAAAANAAADEPRAGVAAGPELPTDLEADPAAQAAAAAEIAEIHGAASVSPPAEPAAARVQEGEDPGAAEPSSDP